MHKSFWTISTSTVHKSYVASWKHRRKQRSKKIHVKIPHQRSPPNAVKFEDRSQEEIKRQERCASGDAWRLTRNLFQKAQRNGQSYLLLTCQRMVSPSAIRNKSGGKRICCRFLRKRAHVEQERPELCRIGNRESLYKSDDGCYSQRRSAYKRRSDRVCQGSVFIRDSNASRRYTGCSLTRKTLPRSRKILRVDLWPEATAHKRWQTDKMQHGLLLTNRCPWFIDKLFKLSNTCISNISTIRDKKIT